VHDNSFGAMGAANLGSVATSSRRVSLCWDAAGEYILSTSSDQTTRLHARWLRDKLESWHEFSRPQFMVMTLMS